MTGKEVTRRDFLSKTCAATLATILTSQNSNSAIIGPISDKINLQNQIDYISKDKLSYENDDKIDRIGRHYKKIVLDPYDLIEVDEEKLNEDPEYEKIVLEYYTHSNGNSSVLIPAIVGKTISTNILGRRVEPELRFARYYQSQGIPAIAINFPAAYLDDLSLGGEAFSEKGDINELAFRFNEFVSRYISTISKTIQFIKERPELNENNIYVTALSISGSMIASTLAVEDRINAVSLINPGCNFPKIFTQSKIPGASKERNKFLRSKKMKITDLEEELQGKFHWDPINHAFNISPENIQIYLTKGDRFLLEETGWQLSRAMGNPDVTLIENPKIRFLGSLGKLFGGLGINYAKYLNDPHIKAILDDDIQRKVQRESLAFFKSRLV